MTPGPASQIRVYGAGPARARICAGNGGWDRVPVAMVCGGEEVGLRSRHDVAEAQSKFRGDDLSGGRRSLCFLANGDRRGDAYHADALSGWDGCGSCGDPYPGNGSGDPPRQRTGRSERPARGKADPGHSLLEDDSLLGEPCRSANSARTALPKAFQTSWARPPAQWLLTSAFSMKWIRWEVPDVPELRALLVAQRCVKPRHTARTDPPAIAALLIL